MSHTKHEEEALDQYFDDLANDPFVSPPAGLDSDTADFARMMVLAEPRPDGALLETVQSRVWLRVVAGAETCVQVEEPASRRPWSALSRLLQEPMHRRSALPLGAGLAITLLVMLGAWLVFDARNSTISADQLLQQAEVAGLKVPPGKVMHAIVVFNQSDKTQTGVTTNLNVWEDWGPVPAQGQSAMPTFTTETWLANGKDHLLSRTNSGEPGGRTRVVGEDAIWTYDMDSNLVVQRPYGPQAAYLSPALNAASPNDLLMSHPGTVTSSIVGHSTLNGRSVIEIERVTKIPPLPGMPGAPTIEEMDVLCSGVRRIRVMDAPKDSTYTSIARYWIDSQSYQMLKYQMTTLDPSEKVIREDGWEITLLEFKDFSDVPTDLFSLTPPPGAQVKVESTTC